MGKAASLFYSSNDPEKQTLLRRCSPSDEQFEEQQERWNLLADHLVEDLRERSGYPIRTWLQGSYKYGVQIRPVRMGDEFDIDVGVYFEWAGKPQDGKHSPTTLKSFVMDSLDAFAEDNPDDVLEVCPPKKRCGRIRYRNSFHIDVPAYHLDADRDARTLATTGGWESSDPKAIYQWFRDLLDEQARTKLRRQIKYLKAWAALKFEDEASRPSSILLLVLASDAAVALGSDEFGADDETLLDLLDLILERLGKSAKVPNPADKTENLNRMSTEDFEAFVKELETFADVAERANDADTELEAADIWQEAFEHLFPMPEPEVIAEDSKNLPVAVVMPEISIVAKAQDNAYAPSYKGMNAIGPIPKNCDIRFEVVNANELPLGARILWVVRNEGREAELKNDLGHVGQMGAFAYEHSAYRGTHYMDCIVKVGRQTVAMRRVPVVISGTAMPPRNSAKRPDWVKLRGRR